MRLTVILRQILISIGLIALGANLAVASSFDFSSAQTAAQTLSAGQTGTVEATGSLTVSGGTVAVTITGNNATVTNLGTIKQTGTGRVIRDNTGVTGLMITNGSSTNSAALMQSADADVVQMAQPNASATLNNYGTMTSLNASGGGAQAVDFSNITNGANVINNYATGIMQATEADAVRPGVNGVVYNAGIIRSFTTTGSSSDGIDGQNDSGIQITNETTGLASGARHGITGGALNATVNYTMSVINNVGGIIQGNNGSGINIDGFNYKEVVTVSNAGTISGNGVSGDGDGIDVDGILNLTNTGTIKSLNSFNDTSEGLSIGGGTVMNSGTIEGLTSGTSSSTHGITLVGNDIAAGGRDSIYGNASVTNQNGGLILGQTDSAILAFGNVSGNTVTITNQAGGTIQGGGSLNAAIVTGLDNDTINDSGLIDGSSSGKAIDMGGGTNHLTISGGSAEIRGSIDGGAASSNSTMLVDAAANGGASFHYSGAIFDFSVFEAYSGITTLSGVSHDIGTTRVTGGTLDLDGIDRITGASFLDLNGGMLETADAVGVNAETFGCLSLDNSSSIDLQGSALTFNNICTIAGGKTLNILDYIAADSPNYAFRFTGDLTHNAAFLALIGDTSFNGLSAVYSFDGVYTDVVAAPTPEPSTMALIALGGLGLLAVRRRRQG